MQFYFGFGPLEQMYIKIDPEFPEAANISLTSIAVVLNDLFKKYEQVTPMEEAEKHSTGLVVLPFLKYQDKRIFLKNKVVKVAECSARLVVYSKKTNDEKECLRMIHAYRCGKKDDVIKQIPDNVLNAYFDSDNETTISHLLLTLGGIVADKISYYYNACACEGNTFHAIAVVHEYGQADNPYCTVTSWLNITTNGK